MSDVWYTSSDYYPATDPVIDGVVCTDLDADVWDNQSGLGPLPPPPDGSEVSLGVFLLAVTYHDMIPPNLHYEGFTGSLNAGLIDDTGALLYFADATIIANEIDASFEIDGGSFQGQTIDIQTSDFDGNGVGVTNGGTITVQNVEVGDFGTGIFADNGGSFTAQTIQFDGDGGNILVEGGTFLDQSSLSMQAGIGVFGGSATIDGDFDDENSPNDGVVAGNGTLSVTGDLSNIFLSVGEEDDLSDVENGPGKVSVGGGIIDSSLVLSDGSDVTVGAEFDGSMQLSGGSTAEIGGFLSAGVDATGTESIFVGDQSTLTVAGTLDIGFLGGGSLAVIGGTVDANGGLREGVEAGSSASAVFGGAVDGGGTVKVDGDYLIGVDGTSDDLVEGGAQVTVQGDLVIGDDDTGQGSLTISGTDTTEAVSGQIVVGDEGIGSLTVDAGAVLSSTYGAGPAIVLGSFAGSTGTMLVSDSGTDLVFASGTSVIVGDDGTGTLSIANGATFEADSSDPDVDWGMDIGGNGTGDGTVTVDGTGSTLTVGAGGLSVGDAGQASLTVSDGATLDVTDATFGLVIGTNEGSTGTVDITGDGSTLNSDGPIIVGESGTGTLKIEDGGTITAFSDDAYISVGSVEGGNGTVTVTGSSTTVEYDGTLTVGDAGTGTFNIADGATWTTQGDVIVGAQDTGDGTINLTGELSALTIGGQLTIGQDGSATVNVDNDPNDPNDDNLTTQVLMTGAGLSLNSTLNIGTNAGAGQAVVNVTGQMTISQDGTSTVNIGGGSAGSSQVLKAADITMSVGSSAISTLNIGNGNGSNASVTVNDAMIIGQGGTATVTVDGAGGGNASLTTSSLMMASDKGSVASLDIGANAGGIASVNVTNTMTVGGNGNATVTLGGMGIGDPGDVTTTVLMTAAGLQSVGNMSIGKLGSTGVNLTVSGDMTVAGEGRSTVNMLSGTTTVGGDLIVGDENTADGTLSLSDDGTTFNASGGEITIGDAGTGEIDVNAGAAFSSEDDVTLGSEQGSIGTLTVDGVGSSFDPPNMTVGSSGTGIVVLSNGGLLEVNNLTLGKEATGNGTVTVADTETRLTVDGNLDVGSAGKGLLTVDGDSSVAGVTSIGSEAGSNGHVTVNVATLELDGKTTVGEGGTGMLLVQLAATLTAGDVTLGENLGSSGTFTVDGTGTTATTDNLTVGSAGLGKLNVTDGAQLTTTGNATFGEYVSANIQKGDIASDGYWNIFGGLTVGGSGIATVTIESGGNVAVAGDTVLGDEGAATGEIDVKGASADSSTPSGLGFGGTLTIGDGGTGTLKISAGGLVAPTPGGTGAIEIAAQSGSNGTVSVDGKGSELEGATLAVGGTDTAAGGTASLTISNQGLVEVNDVTLWGGGKISLAGGDLVTDTLTETAGKISGYGNIDGAVTDDTTITAVGGTLSLSGEVSGTGRLVIDAGSTLDVANVDNSVGVSFASGSKETLVIEDHSAFSATISGFVIDDTIDLADIGYSPLDTATLLAGNILQIGTSGGDYDLQLGSSDDYSGDLFRLTQDASGNGTDVTDVACYCRGTMILTENGDVPVENLSIGDRLMTASGVYRSIKWIGTRSYGGRFIIGKRDILPICLKAGSIDENIPLRDLWISPHHAMYLEGVLIEARDLVNGVSIMQAEQVDNVEYFHIELDSHDLIIAEGALSETFIDDDSRAMFHNAHEYGALYPDAEGVAAAYCARRCADGYEVEAARRRITARAPGGLCGVEPRIGSLRGYVDRVSPGSIEGWVQNVAHPEAPVCVDIFANDRLIGQALANRYRADLAQAGIGSGRHSFAFKPPAGLAFTTDAVEVRRSLDGAVLESAQSITETLALRA